MRTLVITLEDFPEKCGSCGRQDLEVSVRIWTTANLCQSNGYEVACSYCGWMLMSRVAPDATIEEAQNVLGGDGFDDAAWSSDKTVAPGWEHVAPERLDRIDRVIKAVECDCAERIAAELDAERAEAVEACVTIVELDFQGDLAARIRAQGGKV